MLQYVTICIYHTLIKIINGDIKVTAHYRWSIFKKVDLKVKILYFPGHKIHKREIQNRVTLNDLKKSQVLFWKTFRQHCKTAVTAETGFEDDD